MQDLKGKTAVVTGAASGVGKALAFAFAREGMKVVLADIGEEPLAAAVAELQQAGFSDVLGVRADVTSESSMEELADASYRQFGNVHILCNNAGIGLSEAKRRTWELPAKDWDWGFAVNTMGAVNGIRAFVPRMLEMGEEGYVVNTSSGNGGLTSLPTTPIYASSKAALTSLTEVLHYQFLQENCRLKAAVMFPGPHLVNTNILNSAPSRPERFTSDDSGQPAPYVDMKALAQSAGVDFKLTEPEDVAAYTLEGIKQDQFWILPASDKQDQKIRDRTESILSRTNPTLPGRS